MNCKIYLNVPFSEKEEAKNLGAKWNPKEKKWYYEGNISNLSKFGKWILPENFYCLSFVFGYIYLIFAKRNCFKCKKDTTVVGIGVTDYITIYDNEDEPRDFYIESSHYPKMSKIFDFNIGLPKSLLILLKKYGVYEDYSKIAGKTICNHCNHCGILQGNNYIFEEYNRPFNPVFETEEELKNKVKEMNILPIKINIDYGLPINIDLEDEYTFYLSNEPILDELLINGELSTYILKYANKLQEIHIKIE
ncbi:DUF5710 domain-containing protein [Oceanivirga salmonicida]|uniref:DUF5710 domain-containing protein n=1 Tax=Oceanivirga salmonicida TaxID=1769291 RepID=UPI000833685C|nr:DUF5710 domain-containing protein [Oceanivirga salmonicida]